ncbi:polyprenyl synthetase family protein [Actinocorallia lasiicapitis]
MHAAVERLHEGPRLVSSFTFGWGEGDVSPGRGGGKAVRPALAGLAASASGGVPEDAAPGAVAVEFVHAFSLVHDDIMDGDETRRHRPTAWMRYGVGSAILAGDGLLALALDTLARAGRGSALRRLTGTLVELVNGQAADLAFEGRPWDGEGAVGIEEYCAMAMGKTGSLLGCATAVGWLLGGGDEEGADRMEKVGRHLGLGFQAADDVLGIWGDPELTGKPVFNDLRQGKKSLPVIAAMSQGAPGLADRLAARPDDPDSAAEAAALIEQAGGRTFTENLAAEELDAALAILAELDSPAARDLEVLAAFLVNRTH